ncbi:TonB-dependent receptor [Arundinibacter roseus]|uniref:TonB-dependent receptor n=1 Tax=Arundinibacter roseus TaxID=2070510 RepID=A0A4R4K1V8_9BACT|nr:TonB-dependent receptor [Arundinibacter roseus]TDB60416.1 TonB-dependent receptor [Arundinibacter roseus]
MKQTLLLCVLFLSLLSTATIAQKRPPGKSHMVRCVLSDSLSGQPIVNGIVQFNYNRMGLYTDKNGVFEIFHPEGEVVLTIRNLGYRTYFSKFDLTRDTTLTVRLLAVANELDEVTISTQSVDQTIRKPLLGVTRLNIKTIKNLPAVMGEVDILRSLQLLPGVTSVGEASNGVNIRGGTVDQNLMLFDDAPIFNPTHLFGMFSVFPPDAVSSMEVYKGTTPARYGGRAAAVMDVAMANPSLDQFKVQAGIGLISSRLTVEMPLLKQKIGLLVSGRGSFNDFLFKYGPPRIRGIRANFGDAAAKLFWVINPKNTLSVSTYFNTDFFQTELLGGVDNIVSESTQFQFKTLNFSAKWFHAFTPKLDMQVVATQSDYAPSILLPETTGDNTVEIMSNVLHRQLKGNLNYTPNEAHKIEIGLGVVNYLLHPPGRLNPGSSPSVNAINLPQENGLELAGHIEDEFKATRWLTVMAGLRYSYFLDLGPGTVQTYRPGSLREESEVTGATQYGRGEAKATYGGLEPRLGLSLKLNDRASLKGGYSLMRQYMQVISNTTTPLPTSRWKTSDAYIKPQVSQLTTLGYFQSSKSSIFEYSLEAYWRETNNILEYKPGADFLLRENVETQLLQGQSRAYGIEAMATKKKGTTTGWISYTYARVLNRVDEGPSFMERINNGEWFPANFDRPHSFNLSLTTIPNKITTFSATFTYSSGRPFTAPTGVLRYQNRSIPYFTLRNQDRIRDYHRLDFSLQLNNLTEKDRRWQGNWVFTLYNVYGIDNQYSVFFKQVGTGFRPYQLTVFNAPIFSVTFNIKNIR